MGRAVPSSPGNFALGAPGGLEIPELSCPPPPAILARALPGSPGEPDVPDFPPRSTEGFVPHRPRPPVPLRVPVPAALPSALPQHDLQCSTIENTRPRHKAPQQRLGPHGPCPTSSHPAQDACPAPGCRLRPPTDSNRSRPKVLSPSPLTPLDRGISPGLCRAKQSETPCQAPKGALSLSPVSTYTAAPASFPRRWPERGSGCPRSHCLLPTAFKVEAAAPELPV